MRDIGERAQELKEIVKQEKMLSDMRYNKEVKYQEQVLGKQFDWEKITGKCICMLLLLCIIVSILILTSTNTTTTITPSLPLQVNMLTR